MALLASPQYDYIVTRTLHDHIARVGSVMWCIDHGPIPLPFAQTHPLSLPPLETAVVGVEPEHQLTGSS